MCPSSRRRSRVDLSTVDSANQFRGKAGVEIVEPLKVVSRGKDWDDGLESDLGMVVSPVKHGGTEDAEKREGVDRGEWGCWSVVESAKRPDSMAFFGAWGGLIKRGRV